MSAIYTLGIDVGSTASKCIMLKDGQEIVAKSLIDVGAGTSGPQRAIDAVLENAGMKKEDVAFTLATGYGRNSLMNFADKQMSELSCHARGAYFLFPDVQETLSALHAKGIPLGLVTNKPTPFVAPLLEALNIAKYFSVIVGGDDVQNKKPHPEPLLLVAGKLSLTPAELLFVGDSRNDILAARAAGCPSVGLTYGYNYGEAITLSEPDVVFDHFKDLLPALGLSHSEHQELNND